MYKAAEGAALALSDEDLSEADLRYFCEAIEERAGIRLKASKGDLVRVRLRARVQACGLAGFAEYGDWLRSLPRNDPEWEAFTNLLTTNKTDFFREIKHFEFLVSKIVPEWLKTGQKTFKAWSAAASTGEEPYTLAMVLRRALPADRDFRILATDVDTAVLETAKNAVYSVAKKPEIPAEYQAEAIEVGRGEAEGWFRIRRELKEKIVFKQHNLIDRTAPGDDVFDLVLCRNVLIYFGEDTIDFVQRKMHGAVKPGGYFMIGHSESLQGIEHDWTSVGPSVFQKAK